MNRESPTHEQTSQAERDVLPAALIARTATGDPAKLGDVWRSGIPAHVGDSGLARGELHVDRGCLSFPRGRKHCPDLRAG